MISSKEELIREIANYLDMGDEDNLPYVDLTAQSLGIHVDSVYGDHELEKEIDGHQLVYLEIIDTHEDYDLMRDFAMSRNDEEREMIFDAISHSRPFKRFRSCIERLGILNDWYDYKDKDLLKTAEQEMEMFSLDFVDGKIVCNDPKYIETYDYEDDI